MTSAKKLSVTLIIMVGSVASIASLARIPFVSSLHITGELDFFTLTIPICILSLAETGLGIMAISGAALKPLFRSILEKSSYGGSKRGYGPTRQSNAQQDMSKPLSQANAFDKKIYTTTSIAMVVDDIREEDEIELTAVERQQS